MNIEDTCMNITMLLCIFLSLSQRDNRERERHTDRETVASGTRRQRDRETERQRDRDKETQRHKDREAERQKDRERKMIIYKIK